MEEDSSRLARLIDDLLELSPDTTPDPICSLVKTLNDNQRLAVMENIETVKKFVK